MTYKSIHKKFRLNGVHYSREELKEVAYSLIKEGEVFEKSLGDFLLDWLSEKPVIEVQTSGSTGKPKKIEIKKRHMVNSAKATGEFFNLEPENSALSCLASDYIAGKMMLVRAMVLGLELDYIEPSSNPLQQIFRPYDFCAMVPLQLENSLDNLSQIKTLIVGGAPVSNTLRELLFKKVRHTGVFETYGMTETITHIAVKRITSTQSEIQNFNVLPEVKLSVDDRNCLVIDAPKISDSLVATNDVVNLISDTEFEWLGRYDNVINSGGVKLFPEQIEKKLTSLLKQRFFVAGLPDEKLGQKLVLLVEGKIDADKIFQKIKSLQTLKQFEVPRKIYGVAKFKVTANGKIQRNETIGDISF